MSSVACRQRGDNALPAQKTHFQFQETIIGVSLGASMVSRSWDTRKSQGLPETR